MRARLAALAFAFAAGAGGSQAIAQDASTAATSPAYRKAAESRTAEDPKLVWTASQVALVAKQVAPNVFAIYPDDAPQKTAAGIPAATSGGFIVGDNGVLVIDTMLNRRLAEQVMALVREKTESRSATSSTPAITAIIHTEISSFRARR